jgi:hypothetical protein
MVKVMYFVKRAEHLSVEEFEKWWLETHAVEVRGGQVPLLVRYVVNLRVADTLPGKPDAEPEWDGVAEEWFATEADFAAVYGRDDREEHEDFVAHTSRAERLIVREITFVG